MRQMSSYLPLATDLEGTLAQLGKLTRRNLRYYQRMTVTDLGAKLVVYPTLSEKEFVEFNRFSAYAVSDTESRKRLDTLQRCPLPLFLGLQDAGNRWLAFLGGHRRGPDVFLEWQMNRMDMARYSLSTTMRAHLMEYAVQLGCRRLYFVRGTSSSIVNSTIPEKLVDFLVTHPAVPNWVISKVAADGLDLPPYQGEIPALFRSSAGSGEACVL
ncbi:MAG: hypothetical protein NVSMB62_23910 [Acidobacteriaceae bacterium]